MTRHWTCALFLAAWVCGSGAQAATDCAKSTLAQDEQLSDFLKSYAEDCVSGAVDARLKAWRAAADSGAEDYSNAVRAWRNIADAFEALARPSAAGTEGRMARMPQTYARLSQRARAAAQALGAQLDAGELDDVAIYRSDAWVWGRRGLLLQEVRRGDKPIADLLDVGAGLDADCSQPASDLCVQTVSQGKQLMLHLRLAARIAQSVSGVTIDAIEKQVAAKDAVWNSYLYGSKPMLPFDFFLTDLFDGRWQQSDQYPRGFREPPATQWFLLHPSFGVEFASAAADGEHLKPVLYVELIGANRWNSRDRWFDLPLLDRLSGVSLIASYADRIGTENKGAGVLLTFDNVYSVGITRYGSVTGVFVSLDLANLYRDSLRPRYESFRNDLEHRLRQR